ncbi:MAG: bifunctional 2-polyprenyl-6-hydroxyphenol methylase/3-demethylubiquinol 3-O-methyltransferase UbiG [Gammaproteobacteria bacterium]|nr:bifunctional 2-polyprenyl-6-hydroxyphenol methylase/3-demethylubiquinol 3-O-methyltransferase UbiG [Gammaproteobacteria bacterium]
MINHQENINQDEVDKFNRLANDWWDSNGPLRTLHDINPARLNYITGKVALKGRRVLDVGCGGGVLTEALARGGARVQGLDASDDVVRVARQHARENSLEIDYIAGKLEDFASENPDCFDVLTCMELLEHVPDPGALLQTCARLLRPGGDLILSTINRNLKSYLSTIIGAERVFGLLPEGTHDYGAFIRPSELDRWLRTAHFNVMDIRGMLYLPGLRYCALTNDPGVNYLVHARLDS